LTIILEIFPLPPVIKTFIYIFVNIYLYVNKNNLIYNFNVMKNILIYTHAPKFTCNNGGTVVQYFLAKTLEEYGQNVRIYSTSRIKINNSIFNKFYDNNFPIDDNCVVIYCEGTKGNPLNSKNVVRWMLSKLGQNVPYSNLDSWDKNELVYYFNFEEKIANNPDKLGNLYKILNVLYINPMVINHNLKRSGTCFIIKKAIETHGKKPKAIHSPDSFEITTKHTQLECIKIFNDHKFFISYDSITFLSVIAALCGCISIVKKVDGLSKQDWLNTTAVAEYLKESGETLYGIAYGADDLKNATNTIHLAEEQWNKIVQYSKKKYVLSFIIDINNWNNNINTLELNFIKMNN